MTDNTLRVFDGDRIPHEYGKTPYRLYVHPTDHGRNQAIRTGITPPGYVCRAVYEYKGQHYVFDSGQLVPSSEWRSIEENVLPEHRQEWHEWRKAQEVQP